jgi:hypothetical protein
MRSRDIWAPGTGAVVVMPSSLASPRYQDLAIAAFQAARAQTAVAKDVDW